MRVYIIRKKDGVRASGDYDPKTNELIVLAGSILSKDISYTAKFRGAKSVEKARDGIVKERILQQNVTFKSASTAGNFVTGRSTNGLLVWKNDEGLSIKEYLSRS